MTQTRRLRRDTDRRVDFQRGGQRHDGGEIERAGVDPRLDRSLRMVAVAELRIDVGKPVLGDIDEAHADGRTDPLVQIKGDEIDAKALRIDVDLAPGMRGIEDHIRALLRANAAISLTGMTRPVR